MENITLTLLPGVRPVERGGVPGLTLAGRTRFADGAAQGELVRALSAGSRTMDALLTMLRALPAAPANAEDAPLAVAAFILDFGDFLEE